MKITRENYEAWLLDYMEGNLTEDQRAELLIFLAEHPDLEAEFDFEGAGVLAPYRADGQLPDRTTLYIDEGFSSQDEWLAAVAEGDVTGQLADAARADAVLSMKLAQFEKLRLQPDAAVAFTGKAALRRGAVVRPLYTTVLRMAAAAAVFIVLFGGAWLLLNQRPSAQLAAEPANDLRIERRAFSNDQVEQTFVADAQEPKSEQPPRVVNPSPAAASADRLPQVRVERVAHLQPRNAQGFALSAEERSPIAVVLDVPAVPVREEFAMTEPADATVAANLQGASPEFTVSEFLMREAQTRVLGGIQAPETSLSRAVFDRAVEKITTASSGELAYVAPSAAEPRSFRLKVGKFEIER
jgi:hypothetical protein